MRITEIEINNFRAFYGKHTISLGKDGKNLMVYGENGSGKSSFFLALKSFFEASIRNVDIRGFENIFIPESQKDTAYLQFKIKQNERSSSETVIKVDVVNNTITGNDKLLIADANKIKGFFDYKSLLRTHLVDTDDVNIFWLLIQEILSEQENRFTNKTLGKEWREIIYDSHELKQGQWVVKSIKRKSIILIRDLKKNYSQSRMIQIFLSKDLDIALRSNFLLMELNITGEEIFVIKM